MDDDLHAIESWATIFTKPVELVETLGKHWLFHRKTIKADLAKEKQDWAADNYFEAGVDIAMAFTEAVGPIESSSHQVMLQSSAGFGPMSVPNYIAGFLYGLTGDLELATIEDCYSESSDLISIIDKFIYDVKHKNLIGAYRKIEKFRRNLDQAVDSCQGFKDDLKLMGDWWELWAEPGELMQTAEINMIRNRKEIMRDVEDYKDDMNAHSYFAAGNELADISVAILGPAPHVHPDAIFIDGEKITNLVIAKVIAGFAYGMVGQSDLEIIEDCYAGAVEITDNLVDAIKMYIAGGWNYYTQASLKLVIAALEITKEVEDTCVGITAEFDAIADWTTKFEDQEYLKTTVVNNANLHPAQVDADRNNMKADWESSHYFEVGQDLAGLAILLIGPIQHSDLATV